MHKFIVSAITAIAMLTLTGCGKSRTTEQTPAETDVEEAVETAAVGMVVLEPEFPDALFLGTPVPPDVPIPNLEKPDTKQPQVMVPEAAVNLAADKPVSGSDEFPIIGELELITDGDKEGAEGSFVELGPSKQHVQIDLGQKCNIYAILLWHYHSQARAYHDVIVQISDDPDFVTEVETIFNNDHDNSSGMGVGTDPAYIETNQGRTIDVGGVEGRYVRLYSAGNTSNDMNHYIEVEVYGTPDK